MRWITGMTALTCAALDWSAAFAREVPERPAPATATGVDGKAQQYAHLPEHPRKPLLRIIGVATDRPQRPGDACPWALSFHVVFPATPYPRVAVRARILTLPDRRLVEQLPEKVYPEGQWAVRQDVHPALGPEVHGPAPGTDHRLAGQSSEAGDVLARPQA